MKKETNNLFPYLCDREVISIKRECNMKGYRFVYDRTNRIARLEDSENNIHGNVRYFHGYLMLDVKNKMVSVFKYVKLGKITDPILYTLLSKYKKNLKLRNILN